MPDAGPPCKTVFEEDFKDDLGAAIVRDHDEPRLQSNAVAGDKLIAMMKLLTIITLTGSRVVPDVPTNSVRQ